MKWQYYKHNTGDARKHLNVHDPENEGLSREQRLDKMNKNFKKKPDE